MQNSKFS